MNVERVVVNLLLAEVSISKWPFFLTFLHESATLYLRWCYIFANLENIYHLHNLTKRNIYVVNYNSKIRFQWETGKKIKDIYLCVTEKMVSLHIFILALWLTKWRALEPTVDYLVTGITAAESPTLTASSVSKSWWLMRAFGKVGNVCHSLVVRPCSGLVGLTDL